MHELASVAKEGEGRAGKMAFILEAIIDEVAEELNDVDDSRLGVYWEWMSEIIAWIGHGDDSLLRPELVPFANNVRARWQNTQPMLAIGAPGEDIVDAEIVS